MKSDRSQAIRQGWALAFCFAWLIATAESAEPQRVKSGTATQRANAKAADRPDKTDEPASNLILRERSTQVRLRLGIRVQASEGAIQRAVVSVVMPMEWPEQQVRVVDTEQQRGVQLQTRSLKTAQQVLFRLPPLYRGDEVLCVRTYEITRWTERLAPESREKLVLAASKVPRLYFQPSDGIEAVHPEIRRFAESAVGEDQSAFARATAIFQATQNHVRYEEGPFAGALAGLRAARGDCEERSCLFIAACRALDIPARLVWGPGHCWAEFALAGPENQVVWIPADPSKEREIGVISHSTPILQKGDRFQIPEQPGQPVRYLSPRCTGIGSAPQIELIEEWGS